MKIPVWLYNWGFRWLHRHDDHVRVRQDGEKCGGWPSWTAHNGALQAENVALRAELAEARKVTSAMVERGAAAVARTITSVMVKRGARAVARKVTSAMVERGAIAMARMCGLDINDPTLSQDVKDGFLPHYQELARVTLEEALNPGNNEEV